MGRSSLGSLHSKVLPVPKRVEQEHHTSAVARGSPVGGEALDRDFLRKRTERAGLTRSAERRMVFAPSLVANSKVVLTARETGRRGFQVQKISSFDQSPADRVQESWTSTILRTYFGMCWACWGSRCCLVHPWSR